MPVLSFKVSEEEARKIRHAARAKKTSLSEYLRDRSVPKSPASPKLILKRHPISGCYYNAAPGQLNPSLEEIKAALADFP